jgi:hypothetical protein
LLQVLVRCTDPAGEFGFSENDEVLLADDSNAFTFITWADATQVSISQYDQPKIGDKYAGTMSHNLTTKWSYVVRAWR